MVRAIYKKIHIIFVIFSSIFVYVEYFTIGVLVNINGI
jgi:hypothetical protein